MTGKQEKGREDEEIGSKRLRKISVKRIRVIYPDNKYIRYW